VDSDIAKQVATREQAQPQTRLARVASQPEALLRLLRRYQALSQVQAAAGKLQATLGLEPALADGRSASLEQLPHAVGPALRQWDAGQLQATAKTQ